jgi:hypothetical protein
VEQLIGAIGFFKPAGPNCIERMARAVGQTPAAVRKLAEKAAKSLTWEIDSVGLKPVAACPRFAGCIGMRADKSLLETILYARGHV